MKPQLLFLLLLVPILSIAQTKTQFKGITMQLIGSSMAETLDSKFKAIDYLTSSFPTNWESEYDASFLDLSSNFQNAWRVGVGFRMGSNAEEARFEKHLEFGASYVNRFAFIFSQSKDSMIGSASYSTPLGTLSQDTTFRRSRSLEHSTNLMTIDCQIRIFTNRDHWLKAYGGLKLLAGFTYNSLITSSTSEQSRIRAYLNNNSIYGFSGDEYSHYQRETHKEGPEYMQFRACLPLGIEARIGKPNATVGQLVFFIEGETGLELTTGAFGHLTTLASLGLGLRYHL